VLLKSDDDELVVLDPDWFGADVIGRLFSAEAITKSLPSDGRLTVDRLRAVFPAAQPLDMARLLATMYLCAPLHPGLNNELILPCLDRSEEPSLDVSPSLADDKVKLQRSVLITYLTSSHLTSFYLN